MQNDKAPQAPREPAQLAEFPPTQRSQVSPRGQRGPNATGRAVLSRHWTPAPARFDDGYMRALLLAAAVLVVVVLLEANFNNGRYLSAARRMIQETFARLLGG